MDMFLDPFEHCCHRTFGPGGYLSRWLLFAHMDLMFFSEARGDEEMATFMAARCWNIQLSRTRMGIPSTLVGA
jgi:hypothetical protein